jgi:putative OPT family oligopeptide transporter
MAMLTGLLIAWAAAVPILTSLQPAAAGVDLATHTEHIWRSQVRFIGAGAIAVAAIWTLLKLAKPVVSGLVSTIASSRAAKTSDERDRDMSPASILILTVVCLIASAWLAATFVQGTSVADYAVTLVIVAVPFVLIGGFVIAAICGYMAGLIGASNSPVSGVGILSIVSCATVLLLVVNPTDAMRPALVAFALLVTAIIFACATISNDNLQDLKTGQLVGASPRRQQIALIVGVIAGAVVIPPILNLLAQSNGFAGAPNLNTISENPLPAPQATLISALAKGVIGGTLDWKMMGIGALVGAGLVLLDEVLGLLKKLRIPPLAVGIGIYLPMSATFAVVVGAVIGHWYNKRTEAGPNAARAERLGTLVASGLIVGEGLWGVLNSGLVVATKNDAPIGLVPADFGPANAMGIASFVGLIFLLYRWMLTRSKTHP